MANASRHMMQIHCHGLHEHLVTTSHAHKHKNAQKTKIQNTKKQTRIQQAVPAHTEHMTPAQHTHHTHGHAHRQAHISSPWAPRTQLNDRSRLVIDVIHGTFSHAAWNGLFDFLEGPFQCHRGKEGGGQRCMKDDGKVRPPMPPQRNGGQFEHPHVRPLGWEGHPFQNRPNGWAHRNRPHHVSNTLTPFTPLTGARLRCGAAPRNQTAS